MHPFDGGLPEAAAEVNGGLRMGRIYNANRRICHIPPAEQKNGKIRA
jgi:hypothetical protein